MGGSRSTEWPAWRDWELELSIHALKRMVDRRLSEVELRSMMSVAVNLRENHEPGRWVMDAIHESRPWEVVVEPDLTDRLLVVITAYPVEPR